MNLGTRWRSWGIRTALTAWLGPVAQLTIGSVFFQVVGHPSSFWASKRGKSLVILLSCPTPSICLTLSKSVNNVRRSVERNLSSPQLKRVIAFMPYLQHVVAVGGLNANALELVKLSTRVDMGIGGNPFLTPQKNGWETRALQIIHWTWIFQSFPRDSNAFSCLLFFFPFLFIFFGVFFFSPSSITVLHYCHRGNCWLNFAMETRLLKLLS